MQADAIPDWAVFILISPFVPLAWFAHLALGALQTCLIIVAWIRNIGPCGNTISGAKFAQSVWLPNLVGPNIMMVVYAIATDPAG